MSVTLYRAIRELNHEFVYGFVSRPANVENGTIVTYYFKAIDNFPHIEDAHFWVSEVIVFADSICACTGEFDSSGKQLVFEGDILQSTDCYNTQIVIKHGRFIPPTMDARRYQCGNVGFYAEEKVETKTPYSDLSRRDILFWLPLSKVVGNIFGIHSYDTCQYCEHFDYVHFTCPYRHDCFTNSEACDEFEIYKLDLNILK